MFIARMSGSAKTKLDFEPGGAKHFCSIAVLPRSVGHFPPNGISSANSVRIQRQQKGSRKRPARACGRDRDPREGQISFINDWERSMPEEGSSGEDPPAEVARLAHPLHRD